jgi:colanic acid biosynthesis glycosyl transferase WcaI
MCIKKIIFINRFFYPNISATSKMLSPLVFELSNIQELETIVICTKNKAINKKENIFEDTIKKIKVYEILQISIMKNFFIIKLLNYLFFLLVAFVMLLLISKRKDLVIVKTDPPYLSLIAMCGAKVIGFKYIVWVQDVFPEVAYNLNYFSNIYLYNKLKKIRNFSLKEAEAIVVIGNLMSSFFQKQNISLNNIHVIPNFADEDNILPIPTDKNFLIKEYGLEKKFIIGYSGNLGRAHDMEFIINIAKKLQKNTNIIFLITGGGYYFSKLKKEAHDNMLSNIIFKNYISDELLAMSLSTSNVHLISLKPTLEALIVPSKFYGICAVGKPSIIIGDINGELGTEVLRNHCGYVHDSTNTNEICESILELQKNNTKCKLFGNNARNLFINNYTKQMFVKRWTKLIKLKL